MRPRLPLLEAAFADLQTGQNLVPKAQNYVILGQSKN
jgi:hypothetical protein